MPWLDVLIGLSPSCPKASDKVSVANVWPHSFILVAFCSARPPLGSSLRKLFTLEANIDDGGTTASLVSSNKIGCRIDAGVDLCVALGLLAILRSGSFISQERVRRFDNEHSEEESVSADKKL